MSNFAFLQAEWGFLHEAAQRADQVVCSDPRTACFYARCGLELGGGLYPSCRPSPSSEF